MPFRSAVLVAALALTIVPAVAVAQKATSSQQRAQQRWPGETARPPAVQAVPITEAEPNNTAATATNMAVGDIASGVISVSNDEDFFAVTLQAGQTVDFEIVAQRAGSSLDSFLSIFDTNGTTLIESNDDHFGLDSRIRISRTVTGRYFVRVRDLGSGFGPNFTYQLHVREVPPAPGDPTTVFATGLGAPWTAVALPGNTFFVLDWFGRVLRVASNGTNTVLASGLQQPVAMAVDGLGNVLVSEDLGATANVVRITPAGARSPFVSGLQSVAAIGVGPNGDIYIGDPAAARIRRYDNNGAPLSTIDITGTALDLMDIVFSPSGVLHFSNFSNGVFRVVNNQPQRVITTSFIAGGIAFDRDGFLYMGSASEGIHLYSPAYQVVNSPFALANFSGTGNIVFGRDDTGQMTNRLFGVNLTGSMVEVRRAAVRAAGLRVGVDLLIVATQALRAGVMGAAYADTLRTTEAVPNLSWRIASGALPAGLTLSAAGLITGVPTASGTFNIGVVAEGGGRIGTRDLTLAVTRPQVTVNAAADQLLGVPGQISADIERFLDLQGNKNGRFDIGDLQAYLRQTPGALHTSEVRK